MMDTQAQFQEHAQSVAEYAALNLSESDTRAYLVDPVLRILGYVSVRDLRREVAIPATREFLDYELLIDGQPQAIVEAKAVRHSITDQNAAQCVQYASVLGVRWCLITNGVHWLLYDGHAKGPLADKRVAEVWLDRGLESVDEAWEVLSLFSKESLSRSNPLTGLLVRRTVRDELTRADSSAIQALRRAVEARFGERVTGSAVAAAIATAFGTPRPSDDDYVVQEPAGLPSESAPRAGRMRSRRPGGAITLSDLVEAGLLPEDAPLEARARGVTYAGRLRDGQIEVNGTLYPTPSAASMAIRNANSWNGWVDWRYGGETIDMIRRRLLTMREAETDSG